MRAKLESVAAMLAIGDGVLAAVTPQRHVRRWEGGPDWWQSLARPLRRRPMLTRLLGVAEIVGGLAWAKRIRPKRA